MEGFADPNLISVTQSGDKKSEKSPATAAAAAADSSSGTATSTTTAGPQEVTLEQEVKQLVGNVSSWWTDFSKRSQEQISAARKEIESQGGIVSIAKKEALKFEAQLNDAQKAAREKAKAAAADEDGIGKAGLDADAGAGIEEEGKGKSREAVVEGDDGVAVDNLEEKARRKSRSDSRSEPQVTSTGEAIFDVDGDMTAEERQAIDQTLQAAKANSQTALQNVQSFWDRLQADPRLSNIQASMAKTLKNVSLPKGTTTTTTTTGESADGTRAAAPVLSFADVSKQFQASFPHLNWKESQALAKKYYDASENVARDWGKEMNALIGDLVKIVPPEEAEKAKGGEGAATEAGATAKTTPSAGTAPLSGATKRPIAVPPAAASAAAPTEDEDFDWDGDMDSSAASTGLQTSSGPPTTNFEGAPASEEITATTATTPTKKKAAEEDEDGDSDWE